MALRSSFHKDGQVENCIKIGDIVLVEDEGARTLWRMAKVVNLRTSKDGEIRGATLRVAERDKKYTELVRPIEQIYPVEISCATKDSTNPVCQEGIQEFDDYGDSDSVLGDTSTLDSDTESLTE